MLLAINPYTLHYKVPFAFSCILLPHLHQYASRFYLPDDFRRRYGVSTFHAIANYEWLRSVLYTGDSTSQYGQLGDPYPDRLPFGLSLTASLAYSQWRRCKHLINLTISFEPLPLPGWGFPEGVCLTSFTPPAYAGFGTLLEGFIPTPDTPAKHAS